MRYAKATLVEAGNGYEWRIEFFADNGRRLQYLQEPMRPLHMLDYFKDDYDYMFAGL